MQNRRAPIPASQNQWFNCVPRGRWYLLSAGQCWGRWLSERRPEGAFRGGPIFIARTRLSASTPSPRLCGGLTHHDNNCCICSQRVCTPGKGRQIHCMLLKAEWCARVEG